MTPKKIKFELNRENIPHFNNLYLDTDIGQLDCLNYINGLGDFNEVKKSSVPIKVEGAKFFVLDIDSLIRAKKALNRPRDRQAVLELEAIKKTKS